jgi:hypothetical protein
MSDWLGIDDLVAELASTIASGFMVAGNEGDRHLAKRRS